MEDKQHNKSENKSEIKEDTLTMMDGARQGQSPGGDNNIKQDNRSENQDPDPKPSEQDQPNEIENGDQY